MSTEIAEKIRKILNLAKKGGTEEEGAAAMKMALGLLAKHNMSMSDITEKEIQDEDITQDKTEISPKASWQRDVFSSIGRLYFCTPYYQNVSVGGKEYVRMVLTGKPSNISTAKEIANYLIRLGEELANKPGEDRFYRFSFKNAYSLRIAQRAYQEKVDAQKSLPGQEENALMIVNLYAVTTQENDAFLRGIGVTLSSSKRRGHKSYDQNGTAAGIKAGNSVSLRSAPSTKRIGN